MDEKLWHTVQWRQSKCVFGGGGGERWKGQRRGGPRGVEEPGKCGGFFFKFYMQHAGYILLLLSRWLVLFFLEG